MVPSVGDTRGNDTGPGPAHKGPLGPTAPSPAPHAALFLIQDRLATCQPEGPDLPATRSSLGRHGDRKGTMQWSVLAMWALAAPELLYLVMRVPGTQKVLSGVFTVPLPPSPLHPHPHPRASPWGGLRAEPPAPAPQPVSWPTRQTPEAGAHRRPGPPGRLEPRRSRGWSGRVLSGPLSCFLPAQRGCGG